MTPAKMGSNRLNNAMILHVHKERLDKLSLIDAANEFIKENDHRKTLFGSFDTYFSEDLFLYILAYN